MTFRAITVAPDGHTTCRAWTITDEVRLPEHLHSAVETLVEVVDLAPDLGMWIADDGGVGGRGYNPVATAIAAAHGQVDPRCFGIVVFTGGPDGHGGAASLGEQRGAALLAEVHDVLAAYGGRRTTASA